MSGEDPGAELRAAAAAALPRVLEASFRGALAFLGEQGSGDAARFVLAAADGTRLTVRIEVAELPGGTPARLCPNPHSGNHVIQLSGGASPQAAWAILEAQLHDLYAIRDNAARAALSRPRDVLVPGPALPASPSLTAADAEQLRCLEQDARDMHDPSLGEQGRQDARLRFSLRLDAAGLREAGRAAGDAPAVRFRQALATAALAAPAAAALRDLGRPAGQLAPADAAALARHRAAQGRARARARPQAAATGPRWHELPDLAREAEHARALRSGDTIGRLRDKQASLAAGRHPRVPVMIGGGAALAARHPRMLVIDARRGWHAAAFWSLGQAADQLRDMAGTGLGDPYEFAHGPERVPLDALRYWQDQAAARGPVINGRAVLRPGGDGRLLVDISPEDGSPPLTVEAAGPPVVATGFPPERVPGYALEVQTLPAAARVLARHFPDAWPEVAEALAQPTPGLALAGWLRHAWEKPLWPTLLDSAAQTIEATAAWETLRLQSPGLVVTGDEMSYGRASPFASTHWLIAGTGGAGYSTAEFILHANRDAEVVMVGIGAREPLRNMPLFDEVTRAHVASAGGDGRLTVVDGQPLIGQVEAAREGGSPVFRAGGCQGSACVACLGRSGNLPAPVDPLAGWAYARGGQADGTLLYDAHHQYLGYRVDFSAAGDRYAVEVTGAASRGLPTEIFGPPVVHRAVTAWGRELPPESGNPPGGYLSTALQARLYAAGRSGAWQEAMEL